MLISNAFIHYSEIISTNMYTYLSKNLTVHSKLILKCTYHTDGDINKNDNVIKSKK